MDTIREILGILEMQGARLDPLVVRHHLTLAGDSRLCTGNGRSVETLRVLGSRDVSKMYIPSGRISSSSTSWYTLLVPYICMQSYRWSGMVLAKRWPSVI